MDRLRVDLPPAELDPREVVEEEAGAGRVRLAQHAEVVDLHVVEIRAVAQEAQSLTRLSQRQVERARGLDRLGLDLLDAVDQARDQAHRLAVARVTAALPRLAHARKPSRDVRVGRVEQALHGPLVGTGHHEVGGHVVVEEVLQNVGSLLHEALLAAQVLMCVNQARGLNVGHQICHLDASPLRQYAASRSPVM